MLDLDSSVLGPCFLLFYCFFFVYNFEIILRPKYIMDFHSHCYYHYYYSITKEAIIVLTILLGQKGKLGRILTRGVNVRPNPRTRHEPDTGFFGLGLGLNGFGS